MKKYVREVMIGLIALWICFAQRQQPTNFDNGFIIEQDWEFNLEPNEMDSDIFGLTIVKQMQAGVKMTTFLGLSYENGRIKGKWQRVVEEKTLP